MNLYTKATEILNNVRLRLAEAALMRLQWETGLGYSWTEYGPQRPFIRDYRAGWAGKSLCC